MRMLTGLLSIALALLLTACEGDSAKEFYELRTENEALCHKVMELEETCRILSEENELLNALNSDLEEEKEAFGGTKDVNPIDLFFESAEPGTSTAELDFIADCWAAAWETETRGAADWLKGQLPLQEDKALVDAYLTAVEDQVRRLTIMAIYPIADLEVAQEERVMHSGTLRGVLWAESRKQLWRDTFYQLLCVAPEYDGTFSEDFYSFLFDADAMQTEIDDVLSGG